MGAAEPLRSPAHSTGDGLAAALRHLADAEVSVFLELGLEGTGGVPGAPRPRRTRVASPPPPPPLSRYRLATRHDDDVLDAAADDDVAVVHHGSRGRRCRTSRARPAPG